MSLTFLRPKLAEAEAFAAVHIRCWREAYSDFVPQAVLDAADNPDRTERWKILLKDRSRFVLGAYVEGAPAGFINAGSPQEVLFDGEDGHVAALYVLEQHYRHGIGRKLLGAAAHWWLGKGGHSLALAALTDNHRAREFYEAMGGQLVQESIFTWYGVDLPDVVYNFTDLPALAAFVPAGKAPQ